jgi:hypothetical protein
MSNHVRTQRGSNPHTLFLCLQSSKNTYNHSSTSNTTRMTQFDKVVGGGGGGEGQRERYGMFGEGGLVFGDGWVKIEQDFELKMFYGCIFAFRIQRSL